MIKTSERTLVKTKDVIGRLLIFESMKEQVGDYGVFYSIYAQDGASKEELCINTGSKVVLAQFKKRGLVLNPGDPFRFVKRPSMESGFDYHMIEPLKDE